MGSLFHPDANGLEAVTQQDKDVLPSSAHFDTVFGFEVSKSRYCANVVGQSHQQSIECS